MTRPVKNKRRRSHAESGTLARAHSGRRAQRIRRQGFRRRARGFHRPPRGDQQADALPLFRQQGALVQRCCAGKSPSGRRGRKTCRATRRKALSFWFEAACKDTDWVRLLEWEALQGNTEKVIDEKNRRAATARGLERIRQRQTRGQISTEFDPRHVMLAMRSLTMFPAAFPQLTRLIMGRPISDPKFQKERAEFLRRFAAAFRPAHSNRVKIHFVK